MKIKKQPTKKTTLKIRLITTFVLLTLFNQIIKAQCPNIIVNQGNICLGNSFNIQPVVLNPTTGVTYTIYSGSGAIGNTNAVVTPTANSVYTVLASGTGTCAGTTSAVCVLQVFSQSAPTIAVSGPTTACGSINTTLTAGPSSGNTWTTKSNFPSINRCAGFAFTIGNKGYYGTGRYQVNVYNDFWEYDPATDTWTQKANFGGGGRYNAVGFSIGSKGYAGTGINSSYSTSNDFWEYDPASNTWTQKANFSGTSREGSTGFSIGNNGYLCLGISTYFETDLWQYNPVTNTWAQKASFPGTPRSYASGFVLGGMGYVGSGFDNSYSYVSDIWQYDPSANAWAQKASFGGGNRAYTTAFAIGNKGYMGTGGNSSGYYGDIWEYNPVNNSWIQKANYASIIFASSFSIGNKAYVCAGVTNAGVYFNDLSEYTPTNDFSWNTGALTASITATVAGNYTVTRINPLGCAASTTQSLNVLPNPTVTVNSGSICSGNSFTLIPSGAVTYTIEGGTPVVSPSVSTSYTVSGTNSLGCTSAITATSNISVSATPTITVNSGSICIGSSFTINPGGASTYTIQGGASIVNPSGNTSYSVTGTSSLGCVSQNTAVSNVTVNALPQLTVNSGSICAGQIFTISPSGAATYTISGSSNTVSPPSNTSYTVSGTSSAGCLSQTNAISNLTVFSNPTLSVNSGSICSGKVFTITPGGALTYTISGGSNTVSPVNTSTYSVVGTNSNGCVSPTPVVLSVSVNPTPTLTVNSGTICSGYVFTLVPGGAATYTLSSLSNTVAPVTSTSYVVSGTSAAGCTAAVNATANVVVLASPTISALSGTVCAGSSFSLQPTGALTYTIAFNSGTNVVNPSVTTSYSVTGTGSNACVSPIAAVAVVSVIANPSVTLVASGSVVCIGQSSVSLNAGGASSYVWSNGAVTSSISVSPTASTVYSVSGTSTSGCSSAGSITISVKSLPVVAITSNTSFICKGSSANLTALGAATYSWSNGSNQTTVSVSPLTNTVYTVTGADVFGCTNTATTAVSVNTLVITTSSNSSVCLGSTFTLSANGANTYTWNGSHLFSNYPVTPSVQTIYSLSALDANNCLQTATVSVGVYQLPNVTALLSRNTICVGESATIAATGANSYVWNNGSTNQFIVVSPSINVVYSYTVTGTDANNCVASKVVTLSVNQCNGITSLTPSNLINLYPNPTNGEFTIELNTPSQISIYNLQGQLIYNDSVDNGKNKINLYDQLNGIYFVVIKNLNEQKNLKLIKE